MYLLLMNEKKFKFRLQTCRHCDKIFIATLRKGEKIMYTVAVIEDDEKAFKHIENCINRFCESNETVLKTTRFANAETFLSTAMNFDLVFMDIALPDMNGLEAARLMRKINDVSTLIFVTNLAHLAIKGYEVQARDFIVKPIKYSEFAYKLKKTLLAIDSTQNKNLTVKTADGVRVFNIKNLKYVEVANHTLIYHLTDSIFQRTGSLANIEADLKNCGLIKCNRCYYVNPSFITSVEGYRIILDNEQIAVSQPQKKTFMQEFNEWIARTGGGRT